MALIQKIKNWWRLRHIRKMKPRHFHHFSMSLDIDTLARISCGDKKKKKH